jgi:hypothetical protein
MMAKPLTIYTQNPASFAAKAFAEYLAVECNRPVIMLPISELLPTPEAAVREMRRLALLKEQKYLQEAINGLEMGLALAASDPHRYQDWVFVWTEDKECQTQRLALVKWKLELLADSQEEGVNSSKEVRDE